MGLTFEKQTVTARFIDPDGRSTQTPVEIRTHPLSGRTCRITYSRINEREAGCDRLPSPPPAADKRADCPFCKPQIFQHTPRLPDDAHCPARLVRGTSVLFPNLFPYGSHSAVSLFDDNHFVEIGRAETTAYRDSFLNCRDYLQLIRTHDPACTWMAITQNHLPSAGGSLVHPHLQVHADRVAANHHRFYAGRAREYFKATGSHLLSDYLACEQQAAERLVGNCGDWQWLAAYAPEGFFELWGILPRKTSLAQLTSADWEQLAQGVVNTQKFYRSLHRNGYNLGVLFDETAQSRLEVRVVVVARANYAPWARSDHTGYEVMLGEMATFVAPEDTARRARPFWA